MSNWTNRIAARTRSRSRSYLFGVAAFALSNINDDHARPHREDYSVFLDAPAVLELEVTGAAHDGGLWTARSTGTAATAASAWTVRRTGAVSTSTSGWTTRATGAASSADSEWTARRTGAATTGTSTWTARREGSVTS